MKPFLDVRSASALAAVALYFSACELAPPELGEEPPAPAEATGVARQALVVTPDGCQVGTESLASYTRKCRAAMGGIDIPGFDCQAPTGVEIPETQLSAGVYPNQTCDRPNVLNGACDPGSRFHVLVDQKNAAGQQVTIVAHCRKKGSTDPANPFQDVAMIAYNHTTGDTCFFQDANPGANNPAVAPPPGNDLKGFWSTPAGTASMSCVGCHDNGPFIRTPYFTQLKGTPATEGGQAELPAIVSAQQLAASHTPRTILPGSRDDGWNSTQPYRFVGSDFQGWKAYAVSLPGNQCTACHRMGISSDEASGVLKWFQGSGTAQRFATISTGANGSQAHKNPHTGTPNAPLTSPIWMLRSQGKFVQGTFDSAALLEKCAASITSGGPLPSGCGYAQFAHGNTCAGPSITVTVNGGTKGPTGTDPHVDVVDIPSGGNVAFGGWVSLHGPFKEASLGKAYGTVGFDGTVAELIVTGNPKHYQVQAGWDGPPSPTPRAGAGGEVQFTAFAEVDTVLNPAQCFYSSASLSDLNGVSPLLKTPIDSGLSRLDVPTTFIGNLSFFMEKDFFGVREAGTSTMLQRQVSKNGAFEGASFSYGCTGWTPAYSVLHKSTVSDVELIAAPNAKKHRCFLTGISGDWTNENQPFARIYESAGSLRLKVSPAGGGASGILAEASCIQIQP